ncbi:MAG: YdeI/OmpD-associated family protein [Caulobacterales bacterium]|jgi:uncharacterized protein YdeI (YjbR/CyaY-like superfamily)
MPKKPASANKRAGDALARIEPKTLEGLRAWLSKNHAQAQSVWVVYAKKAAGGTFAASDITDEALCFGWIDSLPRSLDETRAMLLISPRKARSGWSAVNKAKVEKLTAAGRMAPSGLAVIAAAKASGAWDKLVAVDALTEPADLNAALKAAPPALAHWRAFPPSARRGILEWILNAKRLDTRAKRIVETASLAAQNKRANQWRP